MNQVLRERDPSILQAEVSMRAGDIHIDLERREVKIGTTPVHLNRQEYTALLLFVGESGNVVSHMALLKALYPNKYTPSSLENSLRVCVYRLHKKLRESSGGKSTSTP